MKYEILKGNLDPAETYALEQVLDDMQERADAARKKTPNTRGHWGKPVIADNPTAFRNPPLS